jgi:hypothetical protein
MYVNVSMFIKDASERKDWLILMMVGSDGDDDDDDDGLQGSS